MDSQFKRAEKSVQPKPSCSMFVQQRKKHCRWEERSTSAGTALSLASGTAASTLVAVSTSPSRLETADFGHGAAAPTMGQGLAGTAAAAELSQVIAVGSALTLSPATALSKRTYPCRTCGFRLSSASNRVRHERAKHKDSKAANMAGNKRHRSKSMEPETQSDLEQQTLTESDSMEVDGEQDSVAASESDLESELMETLSQSESTEPEPSIDWSSVEGLRPLLREEDLQATCYPFLVWLSQPPITQCEALVKARRVKSIAQLQPIKSNLRFIFALLYEREAINGVDLQQLKQLTLCKALFEAMASRQVGSGRIHAVFLLLKKVLVYLSSQESTTLRQFIQPSTYESFFFVDNICSDSSHRRKQESRNRALLGVQTSQLLHKSQPMAAHQAFVVPTQWDASNLPTNKAKATANFKTTSTLAQQTLSAAAAASASAARAASASARLSDQPSNELGKQELQQVAKGCVAFLSQHNPLGSSDSSSMAAAASASAAAASYSATQPDLQADRLFMAHLVTATLCLGLAPRSQVLKQLRIGSSFIKQADGRYWVKILAEMNKNGKPTMFAISAQLTAAFDQYLQVIRPRLLAQMQSAHDYLFVKRNGSAPRADFSTCTCLVTQGLIGRPVNAHAFRAAVVTAFYETGASQSEMDVLATIMAHDPTTAKAFYYRPQIAAAAVQTNDKMADLLLQ